MIIFDAGPLIHLTQIGKLDNVIKVFQDIRIPKAVYEEVVKRGIETRRSDAYIIQNYIEGHKIIVEEIETSKTEFRNILHPGEREAIALAKENNAMLIVDEKKARLIAKENKIFVHGTLGMLLILKKENAIEVQKYFENLRLYADHGWISLQLYERFRNEVEKSE